MASPVSLSRPFEVLDVRHEHASDHLLVAHFVQAKKKYSWPDSLVLLDSDLQNIK
jgi:hypothetical protein